MSETKRTTRWQGGEAARLMIRVDDDLRAEWQADADADAGVTGTPLGPWIRAMVQHGRHATRKSRARRVARRAVKP